MPSTSRKYIKLLPKVEFSPDVVSPPSRVRMEEVHRMQDITSHVDSKPLDMHARQQ